MESMDSMPNSLLPSRSEEVSSVVSSFSTRPSDASMMMTRPSNLDLPSLPVTAMEASGFSISAPPFVPKNAFPAFSSQVVAQPEYYTNFRRLQDSRCNNFTSSTISVATQVSPKFSPIASFMPRFDRINGNNLLMNSASSLSLASSQNAFLAQPMSQSLSSSESMPCVSPTPRDTLFFGGNNARRLPPGFPCPSVTAVVEDMTGQAKTRPKRLHVSNIPFRMTSLDLEWIFSSCGKVMDAEVIANEKGSKGFGFVTFLDEKCAAEAMKILDGTTWDGRRMEVNEAHPKQKYKVSPSPGLLLAPPEQQLKFVEYMRPRHSLVQFGQYSTTKPVTEDMINSEINRLSGSLSLL